jgi:flavin reductase (DIM6/NTAB) family NADH-FMN oxidoreductase RutF
VSLDPAARSAALRLFTYGLAVVTAREGAGAVGATVTWLSQASFEPPMITVALKRDSRLARAVEAAGRFAVSVLDDGQKAIAQAFFKTPALEGDRLGGEPVVTGAATGAPILAAAPAWLECRVLATLAEPDHPVVLGEVLGAGAPRPEARPLVLRDTGWRYGG